MTAVQMGGPDLKMEVKNIHWAKLFANRPKKKRLPNAFTMGRQVSRPARHGISGLVDLTYKKNLWHMFNFTIVNRIF